MLLADDGYGYQDVMELVEYPHVLVMTYREVGSLAQLTPKEPERGFIIYIHDGLGTEKLLQYACDALGQSVGGEKEIGTVEEVGCKFEYMRAFVVDVEEV